MRPNRKRLIILGTAVIMFIVLSLTVGFLFSRRDNGARSISPTTAFDSESNDQFNKMIAQGTELDTGITIHRLPFLTVLKGPTPPPNDMALVVFNHLNEPVTFEDQGFHLQVFYYEPSSKEWIRVKIPQPARVQTVLPPKTEKYDFNLDNEWVVSSRELTDIPTDKLRFFVSGIGSMTGNKYGAFIDIPLSP